MKRKSIFILALLIVVIATLLTSNAGAQDYSIDWYSIDGGGGTSSGGAFELSGTIGQPDASTTAMTGGDYALSGGFWSYLNVESSGVPTLTIGVSGLGEVSISWAPAPGGFILQERTSLSSGDWSDATTSTNPITLPASGETRFFRLFRP